MTKQFTGIRIEPAAHKKLKDISAQEGRPIGDIIEAFVNFWEVLGEIDDPGFVKRVKALYKSCLLDIGAEAYFESEEDIEAMREAKVQLAKAQVKRLKDRLAKEPKE